MNQEIPHKTRELIQLAVAVASALRQGDQVASSDDPGADAWARTGHRSLAGSWAWNPRSKSSAWRLAGRLENHRR